MANHDVYEHRILKQLESGRRVTQRDLSQDLGIALGLTNLIVRALVKKGWVRISGVQRRRIRYLVTPAGLAAKARLTRAYIRQSVRFYRETRDRIREELAVVSAGLEPGETRVPIVFYGADEVAEIAFICLQGTSLELTAMVDPIVTSSFFSATVYRPSDLVGNTVGGRRFARLIVMPVEQEDEVRTILAQRGVSSDIVHWL